jgi:hypothetical protein
VRYIHSSSRASSLHTPLEITRPLMCNKCIDREATGKVKLPLTKDFMKHVATICSLGKAEYTPCKLPSMHRICVGPYPAHVVSAAIVLLKDDQDNDTVAHTIAQEPQLAIAVCRRNAQIKDIYVSHNSIWKGIHHVWKLHGYRLLINFHRLSPLERKFHTQVRNTHDIKIDVLRPLCARRERKVIIQ